jgi:hypothetical protein
MIYQSMSYLHKMLAAKHKRNTQVSVITYAGRVCP